MEPGVEPARVAKPGKVPPGAHEGVLDHVVRELAVSDDQPAVASSLATDAPTSAAKAS
jgi:hypothetical protein